MTGPGQPSGLGNGAAGKTTASQPRARAVPASVSMPSAMLSFCCCRGRVRSLGRVRRGRDREGRRRPRPKASTGRGAGHRSAEEVPGHRGQARPALPRRGLHCRPHGPTRAVHCCRTRHRRRSVHAAPLCCAGGEGAPAHFRADQGGTRRAEGPGRQAREPTECPGSGSARPTIVERRRQRVRGQRPADRRVAANKWRDRSPWTCSGPQLARRAHGEGRALARVERSERASARGAPFISGNFA